MKNDTKPFVAIIGGFWNLNPDNMDEAKKTAREIGVELAKAGMGIVVYFSDDKSFEPHVVSGYAASIPKGTGEYSIRVRYAESQKNKVRFAEQANRSELFDLNLFAGQDWEAPFYRSLVNAEGVDAVILLAGAQSTLIAGQIALARPLPILAIDKFDGSAGKIWRELSTGSSEDNPSSDTCSIKELVKKLKGKCAMRAKQQAHARYMERTYSHVTSLMRKSTWAGVAFTLLLITVIYGMSKTPAPGLYPILTFIGLTASGATGALIRSIVWKEDQIAPGTSMLLGGVAGFIIGLAYIIPQLIGAPGVLEPTATSVLATDKIQFASAVLISFPAGMGFDSIFLRLKKKADNLSTQPN